MSPQRQTAYGSLDLATKKVPNVGALTVRVLVGAAFVGIAMFSLFLIPSTVTTSPRDVVDKSYETVNLLPKYSFAGDDIPDGVDCECVDTGCTMTDEGFGTCEVTAADGDCVGFDFEYATFDAASGTWSAKCEINEGRYDCFEYPCVNGGFCVDGVDSYKCVCPFGWEGDTCERDIDECAFSFGEDGALLEVCDAAATCTNNVASYSCECRSGWYGDGYQVEQDNVKFGSILVSAGIEGASWLDRSADGYATAGCLDVDDCASSPCAYGTVCTDEGTNLFSCDCSSIMPASRYSGHICDQDVDECASGVSNCDGVRSECTNTHGSFECKCKEFWEGDGFNPDITPAEYGHTELSAYSGCTDIDDCTIRTPVGDTVVLSTPCMNGATCSNDGDGTGRYHCECVEGWTSDQCEVDVDECEVKNAAEIGCHEHAACTNTPGSWECLCNDGWTGDGLALRGGFCFDADDCEFSPCLNGGTCTDFGWKSKVCQCIRGYRGKECEIDWNECTMGIHTCHDMAMCVNTPGSFECSCEPGFSGDGYEKCDSVNDCLVWSDNPDVEDSELVDYGERVYLEDQVTIDTVNSLRPIHDASWMDDSPATVTNADGTNTIVHQCGSYSAEADTFVSHGTCKDVGPAAFICNCDPGWSDTNCDLNINECARGDSNCHRYATCTDTAGSFECGCNWGYTGDGVLSCTDIDDCVHGTEVCKNGVCTDLGAFDFRCTCIEGYTDRLCDYDVDECASMTHNCHGGAVCHNTDGSFECECHAGAEGDGLRYGIGCIDFDDCALNPCEHGECKDTGPNSYQCICEDGWKDTNCDYDDNECLLGEDYNDCHEDGKCVNTVGSYYCRCISGYQGDGYTCIDLDDCDPDPCDPDHGTCFDKGQNRFFCECDAGYMQPDCTQDSNECMDNSNNCHQNADCFNTVGSFSCACKPNFYGEPGNGNSCTQCTDCKKPCDSPDKWDCGHGLGYERDFGQPACDVVDLTCVDINECGRMSDNCDDHATCANTEGSYTCTCNIDAEGCFWGTGLLNDCRACYECGIGEYMTEDATPTTDRVCDVVLPDGDYAIGTDADGVQQCLVKWKEVAKVFPERYAWGGKASSQGIEGAADVCENPICGVCDWDGKSATQNLREGMEAVWTFRRLRDDLYMIMSQADGKGYRCLGFQTPDAPYPMMLAWQEETVEADLGICVGEGNVPVLVDEAEVHCTVEGGECAAEQDCLFEEHVVGEWSASLEGSKTGPNGYFCGFKTNQDGQASEKLIANGGAVWNVHALGCRGKMCEERIYDSQFLLRSLARGDRNMDAAIDAYDFECLYFPSRTVQQYTHPVRVAQSPTSDGSWLGETMASDLDGNGDPECGIYIEEGISQEAALVANKQATYTLIPLSSGRPRGRGKPKAMF